MPEYGADKKRLACCWRNGYRPAAPKALGGINGEKADFMEKGGDCEFKL